MKGMVNWIERKRLTSKSRGFEKNLTRGKIVEGGISCVRLREKISKAVETDDKFAGEVKLKKIEDTKQELWNVHPKFWKNERKGLDE